MRADNIMADPRAIAVIAAALEEDIGPGDATTLTLINPMQQGCGEIVARESCRASGVEVGAKIFTMVDPQLEVEMVSLDGSDAEAGAVLLRVRGSAASILTAERTALNFMQRMCGIATMTRSFVEAVKEYGTTILDTRKTTPGLRFFEKSAVLSGGGENHRFGLFDRILIKDNHRWLWHDGDPERLDLAVEAARKSFPRLEVEVEVESIAECESALRAKPEWIMLDNMECSMMRECVALCKGISRTEASGGITLERIREVAATGVDAISSGSLTHSAPSIDLALEWERG